MLSDLQQLLACRRERENRAAGVLRQTRLRLDQAQAAAAAARKDLERHHRERRERQDKLYRSSLRALLSKQDVDDLNIELDLMAETTDALVKHLQDAETRVAEVMKEVEAATVRHRQLRHAGDRFGHLVEDVAETERRLQNEAEEFAIEDDLGDRRGAAKGGL